MDTMVETDGPEQPGRPWALGMLLLLVGLVVSAVANGGALQGEPGPALRAVGWGGYALGFAIAGAGIHRLLWFGPSRRSFAFRLVLTAIVTVPAFLAAAIFFSVVFTVLQIRFSGS
jgi:hypothetical protein